MDQTQDRLVITNAEIKQHMPTMSSAIRAMVEGLKEFAEKPDHRVDMYSFGHRSGDICCGCAATATVFKFWPNLPINLNARDWLTKADQTSDLAGDLFMFELAINSFRRGSADSLIEFYEIPPAKIPEETKRHILDLSFRNRNWQEESERALVLADEIEALGY